MSDNMSTSEQEKEDKFLLLTTKLVLLIFLIIGTLGCLQYFVMGIIGVIRGYSVQSYLPLMIAMVGMIILSIFCTIQRNNLARWKQNVIWIIAVSPILCSSLIGLQQTKYSMKGDEYYGKGQYAESVQYYRKATETWYLPFVYTSEGSSLIFMADAYCQLGNFDKAREIYLLIQQRYPDYYRVSAAERIKSLDNGLQKVKEYEALSEDKKNDISILYDLARVYLYGLRCDAKALDIYMKILSLPVDDKLKEEATQAIKKLNVPK